MPNPLPLHWLLTIALASLLLAPDSRAEEQRPTAMALFPGETVLFIRSADARLLMERLDQTTMAELARDPGMQDFVGSIKGSIQDAYDENVRDELNVELEDIERLPQGEVAFALVERKNEDPAFLLLVDFRDEVKTAEELLEQAKLKTQEDGGAVGEEQLRADKAVTLRGKNDQKNTIGVVQREGVFVAASDPALLASVLDRWDGVEVEEPATPDEEEEGKKAPEPRYTTSLEKNKAFASSLRECLTGRDEPPQAIAFVDPIGVVRATSGRQTGVRIGLAALPALGVDAIEGGAAALWMATDTWDGLLRAHLLIDNPRAGVMRVVRLASGDRTPEEFVPESVASYMTLHVKPQQVHDDIQAVVDRFTYEGNFATIVKKNVSDNLKVDFPTEVLPLLSGRLSMFSAFEPSGKTAINHTFVAAGLTDVDQAKKVLAKMMQEQLEEGDMVEESLGEIEFYAAPAQDDSEEGRRGPPFRPVVAIINDSIVSGTSFEAFETFVQAAEGARPRLRDSLKFKIVNSRIKRLAAGKEIGLLSYEDPEASFRHWHKMATDPDAIGNLEQTPFPFAKQLRAALEAGELPPIDDLVKYSVPRGAVLYDTPTGFHYINFAFKRSK